LLLELSLGQNEPSLDFVFKLCYNVILQQQSTGQMNVNGLSQDLPAVSAQNLGFRALLQNHNVV
jgi:hypothetical protein